jgi:hypothetical protein
MRLYEFAVNDDDAGKWYSDEEMVSIVGKHWKTDQDTRLDPEQLVADAQDWLEKNGYTVEVVDVKRYENTFYWYIKGTIYKNLRENKMRYKEFSASKKQRVAEGLSDIVKGVKRKIAGKTDPKDVEHTYARIARRDIEDANKLNNQAAYDARDKSTKRWEKVNKVVNKEGVAEGDEKFNKIMRKTTGDITSADAAEYWPSKEHEPINLDPSYIPMMDKYKEKLYPLAFEWWKSGGIKGEEKLIELGWKPELGDDYVMVVLSGIGHDGHIQYNINDFGVEDDEGLYEQGVAEGKVINTYLWHGSRQKIPMLEPRQSVDTGGATGSNQNAIYATSDPKVAIAMGLTTAGSDTGMFPNDPQMVLFSGKIRKGEYVYLHKLPFNCPDGKPQFVQGGNSREFHSIPGVEGIKPIEIKEIPVNKYLNLIRKATPADLKLRKKYMKQQGVAEGSYKEGGSITHDGVEYDFDKVLAMAETKPTKQCSVSKLAWVLAYDEPDTTRLKNADISVPVVITKSNNGKLTVIDGLHRLAKAVDSNIKSLPVKYITSGELQSARLKQGVEEDSNKSNSTDNQNSFSNKLQNKLNIELGKIGDLPVSAGIQKAQGKSFNVGSATGSGHRPSVSIGDPQKGPFAQLTNKGVMLGYKKTFESNKKIKENTGQEPGMFEFYDVNTLKRVFHPFEASDIQDALIKADDFLEAIGKSGKGLSVRPVRDSSSDLAEFSTQNNVKHKNVLKEGPSITSTLRAIINDIGEPVLQVYSTMKSAANKFVENKGELKGFNLIAGGIGNRWFQTFWFNKLQKELHHLVQQSPRHTEKLKEFLRTSPGSFSTIADQLPEILETIGKQLNNRELYSNANKWISTRNNFKGYLVGLESSVAQDDEQEPVSTEKSIKKTLGQQANQAEQLVNAIINSLPNNVAGDIRNAIARSPNKLQALQTELQRRGIRPPVAEDAGVTTTANIASIPNPHISPGPARGKRSYIGSPGRSGTKSPPQPKPKKQKPTDNALNMRNTSIFGEPLRRK